MTNGDKIRQMSDEELADFLDNTQKYNIVPIELCADKCGVCKNLTCQKCLVTWLQEEVQEDG